MHIFHKWKYLDFEVSAKTEDCIMGEIKRAKIRQCGKCGKIQCSPYSHRMGDYDFWQTPEIVDWDLKSYSHLGFKENPEELQNNRYYFNLTGGKLKSYSVTG